MTNQTLYAFLFDDALKDTPTIDKGTSDQGFGVLNSEKYSFFKTPTIVHDLRDTRLSAVDNSVPYGNLSFVFDSDRFDSKIIENLSKTQKQRLFNIIERIYLQQNLPNSTIEHQLTLDSQYNGYVAESFGHSDNESTIKLFNHSRISINATIRDYISFDFTVDDSTTVSFYIWISSDSFGSNYPYTTITGVVAPYDLDTLTTISVLVSKPAIAMLQDSSNYIFTQAQLTAKLVKDHSGVCIFNTKYVLDATKSVTIPFALPYCGAKEPTSLECRKTIREYLKENTVLDEEALKSLFPELYISARFYLVPLWDYYEEFTDGVVFTSVNNIGKLVNTAAKCFKGTDDEFRNKYLEYVENGYTKMPIIAMPDELNNKLFSIREMYPTYQDYSTTAVGWRYMTADAQEFAGKLTRCLRILKGELTSAEFINTYVDNIQYLSFTSGEAEFLIMTEKSYNSLIQGV